MQGITQENQLKDEKRFQGIPVAPGIAHGEAVVHWLEDEELPFRKISEEDIPDEIQRFESALIATRAELLDIQQRIAGSIGSHDASIFDAHLLVVEDRTLIDEVLRKLDQDRINIESVFHRVAEKYCKSLNEIDDPYLRERIVDIEDVSRRIMRHLLGKDLRSATIDDRPHIVIAQNLTPSDTAIMNRSLSLGFATEIGSKTSHTAIMARSLAIPAVTGLQDITDKITSGDDVLIDGYTGLLIINPSSETLAHYAQIEKKQEDIDEELELLRNTVSQTRDGIHITLSANIELTEELQEMGEFGAEGIGLYRTEFLYLNRTSPPEENEQYENYRKVVEAAHPHSTIIRTLDIGGDKSTDSLDLPEEQNPFLGFRALRFCLANPQIFKTQLRAILRASNHGAVRIMYPMVSGIAELRSANQLLDECKNELRSENQPFNENIEVGCMIEIPSAALVAHHLAKEVSFFSVGTNDLIQYTIAVDRINDRIAHLYEPTHPGVLLLLNRIVASAHENNIWVGVCGEMAGDLELTPLLVGLGIDELSASPTLVPRIKKAIQSLNVTACQSLASQALTMDCGNKILELCQKVARDHYPQLL
ncbi:MAG: phosphoenolpyruvate--protein phosphotransferase [Chthoniobacterales bacterium]